MQVFKNELNSLLERIKENKLEKTDFKKLQTLIKSYAHFKEILKNKDISAGEFKDIFFEGMENSETLFPGTEPKK